MKRGMPGRTRRGAPPLRRQRGALRVMQATLLALAVGLTLMAGWAWGSRSRPESDLEGTTQAGLGEVVVLGTLSVLSVAGALSIGLRTVRGPEAPPLNPAISPPGPAANRAGGGRS